MKLLFLSLTMLFSVSSSAINNPWLRACSIEAGQFWVLTDGSNDELAMCFFDGAAIGAEALFKFKTKSGVSQSIQAYKQRKPATNGGGCESFNADAVDAVDSNQQMFSVCRFPDGSLIEENTLELGPNSGDTEALDRALSRTY